MSIPYGFLKCKVISEPRLVSSRHGRETEFHLQTTLEADSSDGNQKWASAINVGSNRAEDQLKYRIVNDFHHPITQTLAAADAGFQDLTDQQSLPALDFLRSDLLNNTGSWQTSEVTEESSLDEPSAALKSLLERARSEQADVYAFGRTFTSGGLGIHDVHMNQGSTGSDERSNAIWQDGGVLIDFGVDGWSAYFAAFSQQLVPTDDQGDPTSDAHPIDDSDPGSEIGE